MVAELARAQSTLRFRAVNEAPALLPRIQVEPPKARPSGYQLLPEILPDQAPREIPLTESRFSLEAVAGLMVTETANAAQLADRAAAADMPLEKSVAELERLRRQLSYFESNIGYHRFWQKSAIATVGFFAEKNALVAKARALKSMSSGGSDSAAVTMRRDLGTQIAPFVKTAGLVWQTRVDGTKVLAVDLLTDIRDVAFLNQFANAVERDWNGSEAARARRFRVEIHFMRIPPSSLYPEGVPEDGSTVDEQKHLARFPKGKLVLTTGTQTTHGIKSRYVQIGTNPFTPRSLSHEFGHLLGFDDAYLRGTEGSSADPFGLIFVEWTGILNDMMGAPGVGPVTTDMIDRLIAVYAPGGG